MKVCRIKRRLYRGIVNKACEWFQDYHEHWHVVETNRGFHIFTRMTVRDSLNMLVSNNRAAEAAAQASKTKRA